MQKLRKYNYNDKSIQIWTWVLKSRAPKIQSHRISHTKPSLLFLIFTKPSPFDLVFPCSLKGIKIKAYMNLAALNYVRRQIEVLDGKNAWWVIIYGQKPWCMDTRATDVKATWHPWGLSELQGILNGNILHSTFDSGQGTPIWKESCKEGTFIRIFFHKKKSFGLRNRVGFTLL